jgi:hypothetical protein
VLVLPALMASSPVVPVALVAGPGCCSVPVVSVVRAGLPQR